jgi:arylsulfatase
MKENIVLITADSVRADHCGFMDDEMNTTPFLSDKSTDGIVFRNAIAPGPRTPSSVPEFMTGEPLPITRTETVNWESRTSRIGRHMAEHENIAEKLGDAGYSTAAFTANPFTNRTWGFDRGFDEFTEIRHKTTDSLMQRFSGTGLDPLIYLNQLWNKDNWFSQWPSFYDDLVRTVESLEEPYFLWVFLLDTHTPYIVPRNDRHESSTLGMYYSVFRSSNLFGEGTDDTYYQKDMPPNVRSGVMKAYRDAIRSVDRFAETLWDDLRRDDPLFIFHSDHGEAFGEHGSYGHQNYLYDENIHVPLVMYNSDIQDDVDEQVSLRKLPEMILSYVEDGSFDPRAFTQPYVFSRTEDEKQSSVRRIDLKYIRSAASEELYDLEADPEEQRPLDSDHRALDDLDSKLQAWLEGLPTEDSGDEPGREIDADIKSRLQSLGYRE